MPNHLSRESSGYLLQHADQPVDWYPWGAEAFARARSEDKPILLSIGYSSCHWCHVMAHESFEDPALAEPMNRWFVSIKVDREERPDVDQLYQGVVALLGRGGGWPLTVFLTPELEPFFGGTYFPPRDRWGMPGFLTLLEAMHQLWTERRSEVRAQAAQFRGGLVELASHGLGAAPAELAPLDVVAAATTLADEVDRGHGGFGLSGPKFPNPMNVALLLRGWRRSRDGALLDAATLTLAKMAQGGVYDQLGGGFHRYSVDERWAVPHFEKMLYDNAQLLHLYCEAEQISPRPLWRRVIEETVGYVARELSSPEGAFFSAQDADSEGEEGRFFVWTKEQLAAALPEALREPARRYFGVTEAGNFEGGANVLYLAEPSAEPRSPKLDEARARLFAARESRERPYRDEKVLTGWNGLMIRGLSFAGRVLGRPDWVDRARAAADFLLARQVDGGRLFRVWQDGARRIDGLLEDYGGLAAGLVALYQASFEPRYLEAAERVVDEAKARFWDEGQEAYLAAPRDRADLVVAPYALHDNAWPSGASTLCEAKVVLAALTGRQRHLADVGRYLARLREPMLKNPFAFGHLWLVADALLDGAPAVTLAGERSKVADFERAIAETFAPTLSVALLQDGELPPVLREAAAGREPRDGEPTAWLCRDFACRPPIRSAQALRGQLA